MEGNNAIYNSVNKRIRDFYVVQTRADDEVSLVFADGTFGNHPEEVLEYTTEQVLIELCPLIQMS